MSVNCQVFGNIAGQHAAKFAKQQSGYPETKQSEQSITDRLQALSCGKRAECADLLSSLQEHSDHALLIIRNEEGLKKYETYLDSLQQEIQRGGERSCLGGLLELENLATVGSLIAQAALLRKESRGSHYREDFPELDPDMAHPIYLQNKA